MPRKYRLILQTNTRYFVLGGADQINQLPQVLAYWFAQSISGRSVYDDQVKAVLLYEFDPMTNSYQLKGQEPAQSRQMAINAIYGMVGIA